jgi:hypothetical protein
VSNHPFWPENNLFSGFFIKSPQTFIDRLAQTALVLADGVTPENNTALKTLTGETMSDGLEIDLSNFMTARFLDKKSLEHSMFQAFQ